MENKKCKKNQIKSNEIHQIKGAKISTQSTRKAIRSELLERA